MENSLKIRNFHIKRIHTGKLKRLHQSKKILTAASTAYYTYTPKSQKPHTSLLKGLGNSFTESEILEDLQALQIDDIQFTNVSRFATWKSRENNILLPIYIVQICPNSNIGKVQKINRLNYLKVQWEKIKKTILLNVNFELSRGDAVVRIRVNESRKFPLRLE